MKLVAIPTNTGLAYIDPDQVYLVMDKTPDVRMIRTYKDLIILTPLAAESVIRLLFPETSETLAVADHLG